MIAGNAIEELYSGGFNEAFGVTPCPLVIKMTPYEARADDTFS